MWIDATNGQSYYVVTSMDPASVTDPNALAAVPVRIGDDGDAVTLGAYANVRRSLGPIADRAQPAPARGARADADRGPRHRQRRRELEQRLKPDPRTRDLKVDFVGQVELMRTTFSGLGVAIGSGGHGGVHDHGVAVQVAASAVRHAVHDPLTLVGIVLALMAAGQGFSITALMGMLMVVGIAVSNGILLVDDANGGCNEGDADKLEAVIAAARTRFVPIAMTSLATIIGLMPTALGLEAGTEANRPLALAVVGGLTSSTVLSLFLVPVMFLFFAKKKAPAEEPGPAPGHASESSAMA